MIQWTCLQHEDVYYIGTFEAVLRGHILDREKTVVF
jgi:hypothetical protein